MHISETATPKDLTDDSTEVITPAETNLSDSLPEENNMNTLIILGVIVVMLILIILVTFLIGIMYVRRRKINSMDAAAANSVENPVYSGGWHC